MKYKRKANQIKGTGDCVHFLPQGAFSFEYTHSYTVKMN